ncbi:MAG: Smr/MutS family protein [Eubacteriales bacterium]
MSRQSAGRRPDSAGAGIIELDLHGLTAAAAKTYIDSALKRAGRDVYRIRVIHGYHSGTALRDMVRSSYRASAKVLRVEFGMNLGETDLVLRELY